MPDSQTPLLSVENLSVAFRSREGDTKAVDGVDFQISRGENCSTDSKEIEKGVLDCRGRGVDFGDCTRSSCAFIQFSVTGFLSRYNCAIQRAGVPQDITFSVDPAAPRSGNAYYYGGTFGGLFAKVSITCNTPDYSSGQGGYQTDGMEVPW